MTPTRAAKDRLAFAASALGVALGYYLACRVGLLMRLPSSTPSILWPPNAVLTSALLLSPPRRWLALLSAALPAHLVAELAPGWSVALVLSFFATNCLEALLAAGGMLLLSDNPRRFDTFPRLVSFLAAAVVAAPFISSFFDAAAVTWFRGEPYWEVFRARTVSNMLSELTVVPAVVGVATLAEQWIRGEGLQHLGEALVLGIGLLVIGISSLSLPGAVSQIVALRAISSQAPLALQLPFLLWAAVRFGPIGTGIATLATALLGASALAHGLGPFASVESSTTIPAFTISLIVVATTLMVLATLFEERRVSQTALAGRLAFEELLSRMAAAFVQMRSDQMDRAFDAWLGQIGRALEIEVLALIVARDQYGAVRSVYYWADVPFALTEIDACRDFPTVLEGLLDHRPFVANDINTLPLSAAADRASLARIGLSAALAVPLAGKQGVVGALACGARRPRAWPDETQSKLRLVGDVLGNVLERKAAEDALRTGELMKSAILQSLTTGVVVVDQLGSVMALNDSWTRLARDSGNVAAEVGHNLLEASAAAERAGDPLARALTPGIAAVLAGERPHFSLEHRSDRGGSTRWWSIQVVPLGSSDAGAVITQSDVSDIRRAELEAQRSRRELAHVTRVATVGEMTTSLAHQLNQPLQAIMSNAQAARRVLDTSTPDIAKLHAILVDIVKDDRRASDIIKRLRELLRRGELPMTRVNLTTLVREVADLVVGEAIVRSIAVSLDVDRAPVYVRGDRVQLQQVVLNLLQNAMEAVGDQPVEARHVTLRCRPIDGEAVSVSMQDSGPGLTSGTEELVFEPFYTTKPGGMGMGLSIVRTIVGAHGGSVRALSGAPSGAVFEVTLPIDRQGSEAQRAD